jgi:flagellar hook-length control protein FliK
MQADVLIGQDPIEIKSNNFYKNRGKCSENSASPNANTKKNGSHRDFKSNLDEVENSENITQGKDFNQISAKEEKETVEVVESWIYEILTSEEHFSEEEEVFDKDGFGLNLKQVAATDEGEYRNGFGLNAELQINGGESHDLIESALNAHGHENQKGHDTTKEISSKFGINYRNEVEVIEKSGANLSNTIKISDFSQNAKNSAVEGNTLNKNALNKTGSLENLTSILQDKKDQTTPALKTEVETKNFKHNLKNEMTTPKVVINLQNQNEIMPKINTIEKGLFDPKINTLETDEGTQKSPVLGNQLSDKSSEILLTSVKSENITHSQRANILTQIAEKAALIQKNGQTEIRLDLKPDHLGHIQLQIAADKHQLLIRILAENPIIKEMIETNINQLKVDLQHQGLEIDKFEVDVYVADDSDQNANEKEKQSLFAMEDDLLNKAENRQPQVEETETLIRQLKDRNSDTLVNFFV